MPFLGATPLEHFDESSLLEWEHATAGNAIHAKLVCSRKKFKFFATDIGSSKFQQHLKLHADVLSKLAGSLGLATGSIGFIRQRCLRRLCKKLDEMGYRGNE